MRNTLRGLGIHRTTALAGETFRHLPSRQPRDPSSSALLTEDEELTLEQMAKANHEHEIQYIHAWEIMFTFIIGTLFACVWDRW